MEKIWLLGSHDCLVLPYPCLPGLSSKVHLPAHSLPDYASDTVFDESELRGVRWRMRSHARGVLCFRQVWGGSLSPNRVSGSFALDAVFISKYALEL